MKIKCAIKMVDAHLIVYFVLCITVTSAFRRGPYGGGSSSKTPEEKYAEQLQQQHDRDAGIVNRDAGLQKYSELNQHCNTDQDCRPNAYLCFRSNFTCQCARNYIKNEELTMCVGRINEQCRYDSHCIEGAYCEHQHTCKCKDETPYIDEDGFKCNSDKILRSTIIYIAAAYFLTFFPVLIVKLLLYFI